MPRDLVYPKLPASSAKRYKHRATYDLQAIHSIINATPVLHVSFPPSSADEGPFPALLPMIGQMGSFAHPSADLNDPLDCYLHGYVSSRLMNIARAADGNGLPVTIGATTVDGLILSLTPNSHSYNYRSAILFGYARVVEDQEEKVWAMKLITESVMRQRWENTRVPPDGAEMASTTILRVKIVSGSGKIRDGGPGDDKKDLHREDVTGRVWTGVVPVWQVMGEPIPGGGGKVDQVPGYVSEYIEEWSQRSKNYAIAAAAIKLPKEEEPKD